MLLKSLEKWGFFDKIEFLKDAREMFRTSFFLWTFTEGLYIIFSVFLCDNAVTV